MYADKNNIPFYYLIIFFTVIIFLGILIDNYLSFVRPMRLAIKGKYNKSLKIYKRTLKRKWLTNKNNVYSSAILNIARINLIIGDFEESIKWLCGIDIEKINDKLKASYYSNYALNLLLLEKDLDIAEDYFKKAEEFSFLKLPPSYIVECYLSILRGNKEEATILLHRHLEEFNIDKIQKFYPGLLFCFVDKKAVNLLNNYLIGYCFKALGDNIKAKEHFQLVSQYPYNNFFKQKSLETLSSL